MDIPGYVIRGPIAQGGMATTYLALQQSLQREVAIKVLDLRAVAKPVFGERFLNEGRIVAGLRHPNIITIYDVGTADTFAYISMEYIGGGDLKARIDQGPIAAPEALAITEQIAAGLAAAHQRGIIHRDVKPGNILFRTDGSAVLSDFGIAKQLTSDANLTSTGTFIGSPNYMSPEQADGGPVDARTDIYSLGVLLYEMLTGEKPYLADSVVDVILKHKKDPVPRLPETLGRYQQVIDLMLAKLPGDRFRDADSLLQYLRQLPQSQDAAGSPGGARATTATWARIDPRRPTGRRITLSVLLVVLGIGYAALDHALDRLNAPPRLMPSALLPQLEPVAPPPGAAASDPADRQRIVTALQWLARHSLDQYRLTAPPGDNAYYYLSRLHQLDPGSAEVSAGYHEIADRLGQLAEKALARGDRDRARAYLDLGLQVEADNAALLALQPLLQAEADGLVEVVRRLFR
jgi:serine/threonine-protein kinase PpkA